MTHHSIPGDGPLPERVTDRSGGFLGRVRIPTFRLHRFGDGNDADHEHDDVESGVLAEFRREARALHERLAHEHGVFCVEFLGSTGSGKTRLIERLIERSPDDERIAVVVGDVAGEDDARRFRALGVEVSNVNTGRECHLDPTLVDDALATFDLEAIDTLYLENVGNMVCPADFPLGAETRVLVVSTTEGDDVVRKHPRLFQVCDVAVVNKVDIAGAVGADVATMERDVRSVAPDLPVVRTSAREGVNIGALETHLDGDPVHDHPVEDVSRP